MGKHSNHIFKPPIVYMCDVCGIQKLNLWCIFHSFKQEQWEFVPFHSFCFSLFNVRKLAVKRMIKNIIHTIMRGHVMRIISARYCYIRWSTFVGVYEALSDTSYQRLKKLSKQLSRAHAVDVKFTTVESQGLGCATLYLFFPFWIAWKRKIVERCKMLEKYEHKIEDSYLWRAHALSLLLSFHFSCKGIWWCSRIFTFKYNRVSNGLWGFFFLTLESESPLHRSLHLSKHWRNFKPKKERNLFCIISNWCQIKF